MANFAALAEAVIGIADPVGLASITAGDQPAGTDPKARRVTSEPVAGRDGGGLGIGHASSRRVGGRGTRDVVRNASQPAAGLADNAVPSGSCLGGWFWSKADGNAHRG